MSISKTPNDLNRFNDFTGYNVYTTNYFGPTFEFTDRFPKQYYELSTICQCESLMVVIVE